MEAKGEFRDREDDEVAVLDALVERSGDGMTVFELRAAVDSDVDIDRIDAALTTLQDDDLITVEEVDDGVRIHPDERVVPDPEDATEDDPSLLDAVRERLGL
ncbi:MAG: DUF6432 family protein [Halolamina sp.]